MQGAAEGEFAGAAAESFFGADAREVGGIVLFRNVGENEMARASIENFRVRQKFADNRIGKMSGAAHHALLDVPGIRADLQHFEIVIGFQDQEISFAQVMLHQLRHVTKIGDDGHFLAIRAEGVTDRVGRIMRNGERSDFNIADDELDSRADVDHALDFCLGTVLVHLADFAVGGLGKVGRTFPIARELGESVGVIAVLVGDQDGVNIFGPPAAESFEAPQHFLAADAGINQESGAP